MASRTTLGGSGTIEIVVSLIPKQYLGGQDRATSSSRRRCDQANQDVGEWRSSILTDHEFRYFSAVETATSSLDLVRQFSRIDADFITTFEAQVVPIRNARYRVKIEAEPELGLRKPQPNAYKNRVWFLANVETFSSTPNDGYRRGCEIHSLLESNVRAGFSRLVTAELDRRLSLYCSLVSVGHRRRAF
jgi:hypothetical protein